MHIPLHIANMVPEQNMYVN